MSCSIRHSSMWCCCRSLSWMCSNSSLFMTCSRRIHTREWLLARRKSPPIRNRNASFSFLPMKAKTNVTWIRSLILCPFLRIIPIYDCKKTLPRVLLTCTAGETVLRRLASLLVGKRSSPPYGWSSTGSTEAWVAFTVCYLSTSLWLSSYSTSM